MGYVNGNKEKGAAAMQEVQDEEKKYWFQLYGTEECTSGM